MNAIEEVGPVSIKRKQNENQFTFLCEDRAHISTLTKLQDRERIYIERALPAVAYLTSSSLHAQNSRCMFWIDGYDDCVLNFCGIISVCLPVDELLEIEALAKCPL